MVSVLVLCATKQLNPTTPTVVRELFGTQQVSYYMVGINGRDCPINILKGSWRQACPGMPRQFDMAIFEACPRLGPGSVVRNDTLKKAWDILKDGGYVVMPRPRMPMYPIMNVVRARPNAQHVMDLRHLGFWYARSVFVNAFGSRVEKGVYVKATSLNPRRARPSKQRRGASPGSASSAALDPELQAMQARLNRLRATNTPPLTVRNLNGLSGIRNQALRRNLQAVLPSRKNEMLVENWLRGLDPARRARFQAYYAPGGAGAPKGWRKMAMRAAPPRPTPQPTPRPTPATSAAAAAQVDLQAMQARLNRLRATNTPPLTVRNLNGLSGIRNQALRRNLQAVLPSRKNEMLVENWLRGLNPAMRARFQAYYAPGGAGAPKGWRKMVMRAPR